MLDEEVHIDYAAVKQCTNTNCYWCLNTKVRDSKFILRYLKWKNKVIIESSNILSRENSDKGIFFSVGHCIALNGQSSQWQSEERSLDLGFYSAQRTHKPGHVMSLGSELLNYFIYLTFFFQNSFHNFLFYKNFYKNIKKAFFRCHWG